MVMAPYPLFGRCGVGCRRMAAANGKAVCVRHPAATAAKAADRACRCAAAETGKAGFAAAKRQASPLGLAAVTSYKK